MFKRKSKLHLNTDVHTHFSDKDLVVIALLAAIIFSPVIAAFLIYFFQ